ncbi:MAG: hypothetical protein IH594_11300 [Bacteroidales bacterium]|nr:hypothetical protein [Bacteroidales bacterium]
MAKSFWFLKTILLFQFVTILYTSGQANDGIIEYSDAGGKWVSTYEIQSPKKGSLDEGWSRWVMLPGAGKENSKKIVGHNAKSNTAIPG